MWTRFPTPHTAAYCWMCPLEVMQGLLDWYADRKTDRDGPMVGLVDKTSSWLQIFHGLVSAYMSCASHLAQVRHSSGIARFSCACPRSSGKLKVSIGTSLAQAQTFFYFFYFFFGGGGAIEEISLRRRSRRARHCSMPGLPQPWAVLVAVTALIVESGLKMQGRIWLPFGNISLPGNNEERFEKVSRGIAACIMLCH
jgi:hypothetical protein